MQWSAVSSCLTVFYIFDWIHGAEPLSSAIKTQSPSPETMRGWLFDVLRSLYVLHMNGIMHGRIRPGNVLITGGASRAVLVGLEHAEAAPSSDRARDHKAWCLTSAALDFFRTHAPSSPRDDEEDDDDTPEACAMSRSSSDSSSSSSSEPGGRMQYVRASRVARSMYDEARDAYRIFGFRTPNSRVFAEALPRWNITDTRPSIPTCECYCQSEADWPAARAIISRHCYQAAAPAPEGRKRAREQELAQEPEPEPEPSRDTQEAALFEDFLSINFGDSMPMFADTVQALEAAVDSTWLL